ncbi:MAG: flavodoxin family protein [Anaerolineales bacterium]|jgi:flavodoxin
MKVLIVYFSRFGNTRLAAEVMAEAASSNGDVQVQAFAELTPEVLRAAELGLFGTPTHRMNLPEELRPLLAGLPKGCLRGTAVAAFDTSYKMNGFLTRMTAAKKLDRKLRRLGGKRVARPETFIVSGREGPLAEGELARARAWAAALVRELAPVPLS